ncbi:hypothetical protein HDA40_002270 [Hamadaea flava]|uniref:PIN domain-containing protein n=1 Tax=Hamadaea flava TaxID=1742688 RepID=A0ABV8LNF7_9ACTN|nr:hypothetical protein [Hamadaea flava]MCP2323763.1 hypothetical protein [Hamadaea flava]
MTPKTLLLDTSSLLALGRSVWLADFLQATEERLDRVVLTPAACLATAGRHQPHLVKHVGMLPAISVVALRYHHVLASDAWEWSELDVAHTAAVALPSPDAPEGAHVVTANPELYKQWPFVRTIQLPPQ